MLRKDLLHGAWRGHSSQVFTGVEIRAARRIQGMADHKLAPGQIEKSS